MHAEVQLLDLFAARRLRFAAGDGFVACSKPACACCRLYFRHHLARCAEPESHGKLHLNWSVAALAAGTADAAWPAQRDVLNRVIRDVREAALARVLALGAPGPSSPDSLSAVTRSGGGGVSEYGSESEAEGEFGDEAPGSGSGSGCGSVPGVPGGAAVATN